ncbi:MAG: PA0069 family radical SAM protein [Defluviicoccus sp.]|nr:MAG: PA0069 family radical SAM protein [Defluviicoccus sp.]
MPPLLQTLPPRKGRGAIGNPGGRYESQHRETIDDGWWLGDDDQSHDAPPLPTTVTNEACRSAISRNSSPDIPFDRSINPYRGCEHGCIYCFARPTHAYLGLSPGLDFETRLFTKPDAPVQLVEELRRPGYRPQPIMLGANTDPYQPIERRLRITRALLQVLADFRHPVAIATKSALVLRDLDILTPMAEQRLVSVGVSVTTLDPALARVMEPRATVPAKRLRTIGALHAAGVPAAVMAAPMIPFINDHELERILQAASDAGASAASYVLLRLPLELKDLFSEWLITHYPDRAARVLGRVRDCRGGDLYVSDWGTRMKGTGPYATLLAQRFAVACRRLGLARARPAGLGLDASRFRPPPRPPATEKGSAQLSLF